MAVSKAAGLEYREVVDVLDFPVVSAFIEA